MATIKQTYHIKAQATEVWQALVNPKCIDEWGGGPAQMDDKTATQFKLWGGDIHGKNIELVPEKKLVQEWYSGNWLKPSTATFELFAMDGETRLELFHDNVPEDEAQDIDQGWKDFYLGPLKDYLESH